MSDLGRKPVGDKVAEGITPDSQKSALDKAKETVTGTADDIAGMVQPGDSKSTTQKLSDEATDSGGAQKGYLEQAQEIAANALNTASETAKDLANAITGEKK